MTGAGVVGAVVVAFAAASCGGGDKRVEEPEVEVAEPESEPEPDPSAGMVSGEKLDEIKAFFDRRRRSVARCYGDAIDAGELKERRVRVLLTAQILPSGKLTGIELEPSVASETLVDCIRGQAERWTLPAPPRAMDYSYTFAFEGL